MPSLQPSVRLRDFSNCFYFSNDFCFLQMYPFVSWYKNSALSIAIICSHIYSTRHRGKLNLALPAYFCGQSLRYLRSLSFINFIFYPITDQFFPDFAYIRNSTSFDNVDVFLHVHFFGLSSDAYQSALFSSERNAFLIEDCTHLSSPHLRSSWHGDFLVFSPHKHFALPNISLVLSKTFLAYRISYHLNQVPLPFYIKKFIRRFFTYKSSQPLDSTFDLNSFSSPLSRKPVSGFLVNSARFQLNNFSSSNSIRFANYCLVLEFSRSIPGCSVLSYSLDCSSPLLCVLRFDTPTSLKFSLARFNFRNLVVMRWPDLPHELLLHPSLLRHAQSIFDCHLFVFVNPSISLSNYIDFFNDHNCS